MSAPTLSTGGETPMVTLVVSSMAASTDRQENHNLLECMPKEIILEVFKCMGSLEDIKAMLSTCRAAYRIFQENEGHIAKAYIMRDTGKTMSYKLPVMAAASKDVDPTDSKSIQRFLDQYVRETGPWPASCFTMVIAKRSKQLVYIAADLFRGILNGRYHCPNHPLNTTRTESIRIMRTVFMIETAGNLFYRMPDYTILTSAPCRDLEYEYWAAFSQHELRQVKPIMSYTYLRKFVSAISQCEELGEELGEELDLCPEHTNLDQNCDCPEHAAAEMFNSVVGIENMWRWHNWEDDEYDEDDDTPHPVVVTFQAFLNKLPKDDHGRFIIESLEECMVSQDPVKPRFDPDPDALEGETLERLVHDGPSKFFECRRAIIPRWTIRYLSIWDRRSLETYGAWMRRALPDDGEETGGLSDDFLEDFDDYWNSAAPAVLN